MNLFKAIAKENNSERNFKRVGILLLRLSYFSIFYLAIIYKA